MRSGVMFVGGNQMKTEIQYFKRVVLVTIEGRIDRSNSLKLLDTFRGLIEEDHNNIVIDLSGVDYKVSETCRSMIKGLKECKRKGGDIRIANPSKRASDLLELGGLNTVFAIYDDAISAVGSF